jgi:putative transposase
MKKLHNRTSPRLPDYDYAHPGAYFVTACVQGRRCVLGRLEKAAMLTDWLEKNK